MAAVVRSPELYEKLLAAHRKNPGHHFRVSKEVGCDRGTSKLVYEKGWAPRYPWARPIAKVILEEETAKRRKEVELIEADVVARRRAALARSQREEKLLDRAAENIELAAAAVKGMGGTVLALIKQIQANAEANKISDRDAIRILSAFTLSAQRVAASSELVVRVARLEKPPATPIADEVTVSEDEAMAELDAAAEILASLKRRRERAEELPPAQDEGDDDGSTDGDRVH